MGMSGGKEPSLAPAIHDILGALHDAEKLFWADLALTSRRGAVPHVREASVSLAMIRALQSSLGKGSGDAALLAARLLGMCAFFFLFECSDRCRCVIGDHASSGNVGSDPAQVWRCECG